MRIEALSFITVGLIVNGFSLLTAVPIVLLNRIYVVDVVGDWLPELGDALACLYNGNDLTNSHGVHTCKHAAITFVVYTIFNLAWNTGLLLLTQRGSALLAFLALKLSVPLTAALSFFDWPLIGSKPTTPVQWLILLAVIVGVIGYQWGKAR